MPTTLLVEDNAPFRQLIRETLLDHFPGMTVKEAYNSATALAAVEKYRPDLILMDINLGGESGLNLTKEIKKLYQGMEVVVLTAYDVPEYREAAMEAGASRVLVKSLFGESDLLQIVEQKIFLTRRK